MKTTRLLTLIAVTATLTACSNTTQSTWTPPNAPTHNDAAAAALPQGSFTVQGELTMNGNLSARIDGYVNFGSDPDGVDCEASYTTQQPETDGRSEMTVESFRAAGGPVWSRDITDSAKPGNWVDIYDMPNVPGVLTMWIPSLYVSEFSTGVVDGGGTGDLCAIPSMARFLTVDGNSLILDTARADELGRAVRGNWIARFLDALGAQGKTRDAAAKQFTELIVPSTGMLAQGIVITLTRSEDGRITIEQTWDDRDLTLTLAFTPTEPRDLEIIDQPDFFERLSARVATEGADKVLSEYIS